LTVIDHGAVLTGPPLKGDNHMNEKLAASKPMHISPGMEHALTGIRPKGVMTGEKRNYNLDPGVTGYELWPFSTIEWVADQNKFQARVLIRSKATHDIAAFNSWHRDFADAEAAIALVTDCLAGTLRLHVYKIFGETIETHTTHDGDGSTMNVTEVLALIWSMQQGML
jgi:hypothetical protein